MGQLTDVLKIKYNVSRYVCCLYVSRYRRVNGLSLNDVNKTYYVQLGIGVFKVS